MSDITGRALVNFYYDEESRIKNLSIMEDGVEFYRLRWEWNRDTLIISHAENENGNWQYSNDKERIIYANGRIHSYEEVINYDQITTFTWNGDLLMQENHARYNNDSLYWILTKDYVYEQDKLSEVNISVQGYQYENKIIEYENDRPVSIKTYEQGMLKESIGFTYTGNNITTISMYDVYNGVEGGVNCLQDRSYDENDCMVTSTDKCDGEITEHWKYNYEEGNGNFDDYLIANGNWVYVYLFPNTFPSDDIYLKK